MMKILILATLLIIGITSCTSIKHDIQPVWKKAGKPPKNLITPEGFYITPVEAVNAAQKSKLLSLKHIWHVYADSQFYYIHDIFLGSSPQRAYKQGLRIDGKSGEIKRQIIIDSH